MKGGGGRRGRGRREKKSVFFGDQCRARRGIVVSQPGAGPRCGFGGGNKRREKKRGKKKEK